MDGKDRRVRVASLTRLLIVIIVSLLAALLLGLFVGSIMGRMWHDVFGSFTPYGL